MSRVQTINPATEEIIGSYEPISEAQVERGLEAAESAFQQWRKMPLDARLDCLNEFAESMRAARITMAEMITREMGKTLKESLSEVDKCILSCKTLGEQFPKWRQELVHDLPGGYHIAREPLGVILGIMPWNFPLWQVVRFAVPAMLCGNAVLMKHAPSTWGCAEFIETLFNQAFPPGLYVNLNADVSVVSRLLGDDRVRGVSLTGSVRAGQSVAEIAGRNLKKCVLELGGSDAYVILDDANLEATALTCVTSRLMNAGQSCVAAKRFIVTQKNSAEFTERMKALMETKKLGDPTQSTTDLGPMARRDLRDQLHEQVLKSVKQGAHLVLGGMIPEHKGFYFPPTMLVGVKPGQTAFDEELFGPVAAVIEAKDEIAALKLANQSRFGLGGAVFSRDLERARHLAITEMDAGMVFVNDFVRSDAMVPFGGVKTSGLGRELGKEGSFEFTNVKTVLVKS